MLVYMSLIHYHHVKSSSYPYNQYILLDIEINEHATGV